MSAYEKFDTAEGAAAEEDDGKDVGCCSDCLTQYNPRRDPVEFLSLLSLIALSIGILLTMAGYLVPRQYEFDADMEATKMEEIEIYHDRLAWNLDVCIIVGMAFVVVGGLILAGIITYLHVTSDFWAALCGDLEPQWDGPVPPSQRQSSTGSSFRKPVTGYQSTGSRKGSMKATAAAADTHQQQSTCSDSYSHGS